MAFNLSSTVLCKYTHTQSDRDTHTHTGQNVPCHLVSLCVLFSVCLLLLYCYCCCCCCQSIQTQYENRSQCACVWTQTKQDECEIERDRERERIQEQSLWKLPINTRPVYGNRKTAVATALLKTTTTTETTTTTTTTLATDRETVKNCAEKYTIISWIKRTSTIIAFAFFSSRSLAVSPFSMWVCAIDISESEFISIFQCIYLWFWFACAK